MQLKGVQLQGCMYNPICICMQFQTKDQNSIPEQDRALKMKCNEFDFECAFVLPICWELLMQTMLLGWLAQRAI